MRIGIGIGIGFLQQRAAISAPVVAVANQTVQMGADTLAGDGGIHPRDANGNAVTLTGITDQTGATRTWSISGGRAGGCGRHAGRR